MTKEELKNLDIFSTESRFHPNRYIIGFLGEEINLTPPISIEDVYKKIYELGIEKGKEDGRLNVIKGIKEMLDIT